jgi:hypothetical protein
VLLYLLRQKRPNLEISSTLLWSKVLADMRASTPFQKLRRNLLLLLQLLILAALVFTLMRPVVQAQAGQTRAGAIVIDTTASMQALDGGAGQSRLDRAKAEAKKLVETMRPGDRYKLIADGGGLNRVGYDFMTSKSELIAQIDGIKASDASSDLSESLILAAESLRAIGGNKGGGPGGGPGAEPAKPSAVIAGKVWLFSDGVGVRVPDVMGKDGDLLRFVKIGESDHSVGVTQLSITPVAREPGTYQVFVGLKNAWNVERKVGVLLALGDKDAFMPGQAQAVMLPPGGQGGMVFEKVVVDPAAAKRGAKLFVRVDDTDDDFPLDNTAYGILQPPRKVKVVLATKGNQVLENFIKAGVGVGAMEGQIVAPEALSGVLSSATPPDLVMLDEVVPAQLPKADTLLIRPVVKGAGEVAGFKVTAEMADPPVLRWKREDPVMQYVELGDLRISRALMLERDPATIELVSAPESPLIAYRDFGSVRRYFVGFSPLLESNWWQQLSLIIFLNNVVEQTRLRHYIGMPQLLATGTPAKLWDLGEDAGSSVKVNGPNGAVETSPVKDGSAEFEHTDKAGFYEVNAGSKTSLFAANLLSSTESDIGPKSLQTTTGGNVEEAASVTSVNKEVWQWLAIAALVVLLLEWWVYHRRIA